MKFLLKKRKNTIFRIAKYLIFAFRFNSQVIRQDNARVEIWRLNIQYRSPVTKEVYLEKNGLLVLT